MRRVQQVAAFLQKKLALLVDETLDKDLGIVSITYVDVQPDLKSARVYISCLNRNSEKKVLKKLEDNAKEFQHILGRHLKTKFTPKITFLADRGVENVAKIEQLLEKIKKSPTRGIGRGPKG